MKGECAVGVQGYAAPALAVGRTHRDAVYDLSQRSGAVGPLVPAAEIVAMNALRSRKVQRAVVQQLDHGVRVTATVARLHMDLGAPGGGARRDQTRQRKSRLQGGHVDEMRVQALSSDK